MSIKKGGPKWRVTKRHPKAYALKQQNTGHWKVFVGKRCIGDGTNAVASSAWADADRRTK